LHTFASSCTPKCAKLRYPLPVAVKSLFEFPTINPERLFHHSV